MKKNNTETKNTKVLNVIRWIALLPVSNIVFVIVWVLLWKITLQQINPRLLNINLATATLYRFLEHFGSANAEMAKYIERATTIKKWEICFTVLFSLIITFFLAKYIAPKYKKIAALITTLFILVVVVYMFSGPLSEAWYGY